MTTPAPISDEELRELSSKFDGIYPLSESDYYPDDPDCTDCRICDATILTDSCCEATPICDDCAHEVAEKMHDAFPALIARLKRAEAERDRLWKQHMTLISHDNAERRVLQLESERDRLREALELADELMDAMDTWLALKDEPPQSWLTAGTQVCLAADRLRNHRAAAALADAGKGGGECK